MTKFLSIFGLNQQYIFDAFELYGKESENRLTKETQGHVTRGTFVSIESPVLWISDQS